MRTSLCVKCTEARFPTLGASEEESMPRVPRWMQLARDAAYHVMTRGHNRGALFADADDTRYFLGLLDRYRRRFGFRLHHYCLKEGREGRGTKRDSLPK
jgi:hypothetical protein